jgi:RNA polymerase sigma factor (sigma-70 family)
MVGVGGTDRQLLDHFIRGRDAAAFRGLVARHGPAVHRVCQAVLRDPHEAEDAVQATFLVLVRKAPAIRDPELLGAWLRGVAYRVAVRVRRRAAHRRVIERARAEMSRDEDRPVPSEITAELRRIVRDELDRLPDSYRQPVTLCYLEGLTHQEAARRLDWPVGTVKVRLVRARRLLRERLDRRGVALGAGLLLFLRESRAEARDSTGLGEATVRAMVRAASGRPTGMKSRLAPGLASARAKLALAGGLVASRIGAGVLLAGLLLGAGGTALFAFSGPPSPEVDAASLPANLTDILNVECR